MVCAMRWFMASISVPYSTDRSSTALRTSGVRSCNSMAAANERSALVGRYTRPYAAASAAFSNFLPSSGGNAATSAVRDSSFTVRTALRRSIMRSASCSMAFASPSCIAFSALVSF